MRRALSIALSSLALLAPATAALAGETITYTYDAKGRLTSARNSGGPNSGVAATYTYDAADNRTEQKLTGSAFDSAVQGVLVLPFGGVKVIPITPLASGL